jgi:hypothetical protein
MNYHFHPWKLADELFPVLMELEPFPAVNLLSDVLFLLDLAALVLSPLGPLLARTLIVLKNINI